MAEKLEITVDVDTAESAAKLQAVVAAMLQLRDAAGPIDVSLRGIETSIGGAGTAASAAADKIGGLNTQMSQTAKSGDALHASAKGAGDAVKETGTHAEDAGKKMGTAATSANDLATNVAKWVAAGLGVKEIVGWFENYVQSLEKVRDIQRELTNLRLSESEKLEPAMRQLGLTGAAGQDHLRKIQRAITANRGLTTETATDAAELASKEGLDPASAAGQDYATQIAYFMQRNRMDKEKMRDVLKVFQMRGFTGAEGFRAGAAETDELIRASNADPAKFMQGYTDLMSHVGKGFDPKHIAALYSGLIGVSRNEQRASYTARQLMQLAEGGNVHADKFLAHELAPGGAVSDEDLAEAIGKGGTPTSDRIRSERLRIQAAEDRIRKQDDDFAHPRSHRRPTARERDEHDTAMADERARLQEERHRLREEEQKLRTEMQQQREHAAYEGLTPEQRLTAITGLVERGSPADRQRIVEGIGARRTDPLFLYATPEAAAVERRAREAMSRARASDTDAINKSYEETDIASQRRADTRNKLDMLESVGPGELFSKQLFQRADTQFKIKKGSGKFDVEAGDEAANAVAPEYNKSRHLAMEAYALVFRSIEDLRDRIDASPTLSRKFGGAMQQIIDQYNAINKKGLAAYTPQLLSVAIDALAKSVGTLQSDVDRDVRTRTQQTETLEGQADIDPAVDTAWHQLESGPTEAQNPGEYNRRLKIWNDLRAARMRQIRSKGAGPSTRPATQPSADAGDADVDGASQTIIHNHYDNRHTSVGNLFSHGGEAPDLPGRLEGWV